MPPSIEISCGRMINGKGTNLFLLLLPSVTVKWFARKTGQIFTSLTGNSNMMWNEMPQNCIQPNCHPKQFNLHLLNLNSHPEYPP